MFQLTSDKSSVIVATCYVKDLVREGKYTGHIGILITFQACLTFTPRPPGVHKTIFYKNDTSISSLA